jgi:ABC-2 type transport system permease protein
MTAALTSTGKQTDHLWRSVSKLAYLRWQIFYNGMKRATPFRRILYLCLLVLGIGVCSGGYFLSMYLLRLINSPQILESGLNLNGLITNIPSLVMSGAFIGILMVSFGILLQALYLANDMDFLLSAPIPIRAVFLTKLLQAILPDFVLVCVLCVPALFGLGMVERYNLLFFPFVFVLLIFLSLAAAGISSLLVMVVVRFIPAKRVAEILAFLAALFFMLLSQWSNLTGISSASFTPDQLAKGLQSLSKLSTSWSPLAWGGHALVNLGEGHWLPGIFFLTLTLAVSTGVFALALTTAEHLYYSGWASMQVVVKNKKPHRHSQYSSTIDTRPVLFKSMLPTQVRAILVKDVKILWRDLRWMSKLIMPLIMGIVFTVMLLRGGGGQSIENGDVPILLGVLIHSVSAYGSMLIPLLVGWMLILNISMNSFSMEGKCYWIIKSSPVSSQKQLAAKFLVAYLPTLILVWLYMFLVAIFQKVPMVTLIYIAPSTALIIAGMVSINLYFGVHFANLNWSDPRHMTDGVGSYLAMIAGIGYLIICVFLFIAPAIGLPMLGISETIGKLIGIMVGSVVCAACVMVPLGRVKGRVYRLGED